MRGVLGEAPGMRLLLLTLLVSACATTPPPAAVAPAPQPSSLASVPADLRAKLAAALDTEARGPSQDELRTFGAPAAVLAALKAIAEDVAAAPSVRSRAVSAMALIDDPSAVAMLVAVAIDQKAEGSSRRSAIIGLGNTRKQEARPTLEQLAKDPDPELRGAAEKALQKLAPSGR